MKILLAALTSSFMLVGCTPRIEVAAPKEPITINMNVKIEHEIIIKADKDQRKNILFMMVIKVYRTAFTINATGTCNVGLHG